MVKAEGGRETVAVIRIECEAPLVVSCAGCGWTPGLWTPDPGPLLHAVVDHWLAKHWAGVDDAAAGEPTDGAPAR